LTFTTYPHSRSERSRSNDRRPTRNCCDHDNDVFPIANHRSELAAANARHVEYAPYLDYRPLAADEPQPEAILARPECTWVGAGLEQTAQRYAVASVVPEHVDEIRRARQPLLDKTRDAVQDRLTKEISHWDRRAEDLKLQEQSGRTNARLNSAQARHRADRPPAPWVPGPGLT